MKYCLILLMLVYKCQSQKMEWQLELTREGLSIFINDIDFDSEGNLYVAGRFVTANYGAFLSKYSASGELVWSDTIKGGHNTTYNNLAIDNDNMIWVIGQSSNINNEPIISGNPVNQGDFRLQYNSSGKRLSVEKFFSSGDLVFSPAENAFYLATSATSNGLKKFDANWSILWEQNFINKSPVRIRLYKDGLIAGSFDYYNSSCHLAKVSGMGLLFWEKVVGNGNFHDMAVDDSGNIFISKLTEIQKYDGSGNAVGSFECGNNGGYGLEHRAGLLYTNGGGLPDGKIVTTSFDGDFNFKWSDYFYLSECCPWPSRIVANGNGLYSFGRLGNYSAFITKYMVDFSTGIQEQSPVSSKVYPNPAVASVTVEGLTEGPVRIYDLSGKLVVSGSSKNSAETFDVSSLPAGVYCIFSGKQRAVEKLVIIK